MALFVAQTVSLRLFGHNLTDCATIGSNLVYIRQFKNRQEIDKIKQNKGYRFSFFLHSKKPIKTTHKPRQELKPVKNTKSYRYAEIRHKTVTFLYGRKIQ